jgi:hypothetical protein
VALAERRGEGPVGVVVKELAGGERTKRAEHGRQRREMKSEEAERGSESVNDRKLPIRKWNISGFERTGTKRRID